MARETKRIQILNAETGEVTIREFTEAEYAQDAVSEARQQVKTDARNARLTTLQGLKAKLLDETITYEELLQLLREGRKV
jgi:hypothetical protein